MSGNVLRVMLAAVAGVALVACHASKPGAPARRYEAQGVIEHISSDRHVATIRHEAIAGYMMAMTMDFSVRDEHLLAGLSRGDQIRFTLDVTNDDSWIGAIERVRHTNLPAKTTATSFFAPTLKPGDPLPDAELVAENGKAIHLSDFHGNVVVLTFFFTRCPLPNYCPMMNHNFGETRRVLMADPKAPKNWLFLSISFDPEFDTPQTLASYADFYRQHNPDRWWFASATPENLARLAAPLGLIVMRSADGSISHNLRTVVLDRQGCLVRQFNDNLWTPPQLAQAIDDAAR